MTEKFSSLNIIEALGYLNINITRELKLLLLVVVTRYIMNEYNILKSVNMQIQTFQK